VTFSRKEDLYIISIEKPFLNGDIVVVAFANAFVAAFLSL